MPGHRGVSSACVRMCRVGARGAGGGGGVRGAGAERQRREGKGPVGLRGRGERKKERGKENGKMGKKRKRKGGERERKRRDASATTAANGRAWPTGGRSARDGTAARKKRESEVRSAKRKDRHDEWNRVFGTEKRFSGVRVLVLGGFELNDEK